MGRLGGGWGSPGRTRPRLPGAARPAHGRTAGVALSSVVWPSARHRLRGKGRWNVTSVRPSPEGRISASQTELQMKWGGRGGSHQTSGRSPPSLHLASGAGGQAAPLARGGHAWHSGGSTGLRAVGGLPAGPGRGRGCQAGQRGGQVPALGLTVQTVPKTAMRCPSLPKTHKTHLPSPQRKAQVHLTPRTAQPRPSHGPATGANTGTREPHDLRLAFCATGSAGPAGCVLS